jgi:hypothetical protein
MVSRFVLEIIPCATTGPTSQGSLLLGRQLPRMAAVPAIFRVACEKTNMRQEAPRSPPPFTDIFDIPIIDCAQAHGHQNSTSHRPSTSRQDGAVNKRLGVSHSVLLSASLQGSKTGSIMITHARGEEARRDGLGSRLQRRHEIISRNLVVAGAWQAKRVARTWHDWHL